MLGGERKGSKYFDVERLRGVRRQGFESWGVNDVVALKDRGVEGDEG